MVAPPLRRDRAVVQILVNAWLAAGHIFEYFNPLVFVDGVLLRLFLVELVPLARPLATRGARPFFVQGALNRDYTLVMGTVVLIAVLVVVFNLVVDLLYAALDPRVRLREMKA